MNESGLLLFKLTTNTSTGIPCIDYSIVLNMNYEIAISKHEMPIDNTNFLYVGSGRCYKYSLLNTLMKDLMKFEFSLKEQQTFAINIIKSMFDKLKLGGSITEATIKRLAFLKEQFNLNFIKAPIYSTETLIFAALLNNTYSAGYRHLRCSNLLILPHPNYLSIFSSGNLSTGVAENYLKKQFEFLEPHEKYVVLMADEIYVKNEFTFKRNSIFGNAENIKENDPLQPASTILTVMIQSLLSKHKEVIGLYPVKRLDGDYQTNILDQCLILLHNIGYIVIVMVMDNHKVNNKTYKIFSSSDEIATYFTNKYMTEQQQGKIFLTFDHSHLIKSIRNNFQNASTFHFPSFDEEGVIRKASISDLERLYEIERFKPCRLAPGLTYKSLHTPKLSRQNVSLALKIFDRKTIAALKYYQDDIGEQSIGTIEFLSVIATWWDVMNVGHPEKGQHLRNPMMDPIKNPNDAQICFLRKFVSWCQNWSALLKKDLLGTEFYESTNRVGKLTKETGTSLLHASKVAIEICEYLLNNSIFENKFKYVLLGKLSTDKLERHFGMYRKMSGNNYNVSVLQILESQKKLRCISILKLRQHSNQKISLKNFVGTFNEESYTIVPIDNIDEIIDRASEMVILTEDLNAIVYCSGYVARKVSERVKCENCRYILETNTEIEVEFDANTEYIMNLDRGGLRYPSQFSCDIGIMCYQAFQVNNSESGRINYELF